MRCAVICVIDCCLKKERIHSSIATEKATVSVDFFFCVGWVLSFLLELSFSKGFLVAELELAQHTKYTGRQGPPCYLLLKSCNQDDGFSQGAAHLLNLMAGEPYDFYSTLRCR